MPEHLVNYQLAFEALPGSFILLAPDRPRFTILGFSEELLRQSGRRRQDIVGKGIFEVFPENPAAPSATGPASMKSSLEEAIDTRQAHQMPLVRYDIPDGLGSFQVRYWSASNRPVLSPAGEVLFLLHSTADVTQAMVAQQKMQESEERFRTMVEQAPVAIALTRGPDLVVESINAFMLPIIGRKHAAEVIGKTLGEVLPEPEAQPVLGLIRRVYQTGEPFQGLELPATLRIEGQLRQGYYNISYTPLRENGQVTGVIQLAVEVTEQVLARKHIEQSEQQVRTLVEAAPFPIGVFVGPEFRIQLANQAILEGWGKGPNVIGKPLTEVLPELENQAVLAQLHQVHSTGQPLHLRNQALELVMNGVPQTFYYHYSFTPLRDNQGKVYGILNTAAQVTDLVLAHQRLEAVAARLQESEARFRTMADAAPSLLWVLNPDMSVGYVNRAFLEFVGVREEQAYLASGWEPYIHPEDSGHIRQVLTKAFRDQAPYVLEHRLRRHDGQYRWLLTQGAPSYLPSGELYGYVGSGIDITDLTQANEQLQLRNVDLNRVNSDLDRTNRDLDNFIYTASHDLKAPILNIEGLIKVLSRKLSSPQKEDETVQELIGMIEASVRRFKETIGDLTDIARIQKQMDLEREPVDLPEIVSAILLDLTQPIAQAAARIEIFLAECPRVLFPRKNLKSVVYNLLSNAIKYRDPHRTPHITLRCYAEGDYQVLSVQDNGLGMDTRNPDKIFGMFKRQHAHVEGTGVGLYIVKKMIENAGGKIEVQSTVGEGSTFRVYFKQ
ncbi:MAG: PAS domain-containing protein [Cytophagales bacterium]|nr:PAS domain-containing protein [Cytophagales bacterium]